MKNVFLIFISIFAILLMVCGFLSLLKKEKIAKSVFSLELIALISIFFYTIPQIYPEVKYASLFHSLYLVTLDWLLYFLLDYVCVFTEVKSVLNNDRFFKMLFLDIAILDAVSLISNTLTGFAFKMTPYIKNDVFQYWNISYGTFFYIHLLFCYTISGVIIYELFRKIKTSAKLYRKNYEFILIAFLCVVLLNAIFIFLGEFVKFNLSIVTYGVLAIIIHYFTFYVVPVETELKLLSLISENLNSGVLCFDANGKLIYTNKYAKSVVDSNNKFREQIELFKALEYDTINRNVDFEQTYGSRLFSEIFQNIRDKNNRLLGSFIKFDDITDEQRNLEEETYRSNHDPLTGLFNRNAFFKKAEETIRSEPEIPRYLICTNIKNFKLVNDLFGMHFGDELLKSQAQNLRQLSENRCIFGRISGDKFAILMQKKDFNPADIVFGINKIQDFTKVLKFKLHVYIGVYEIADPYESVNQMYDKAHLAIKNIRGDYDQTLVFYDTSMMKNLIEERNVVNEFTEALIENQFSMFLQPQVRTSDEHVIGAEALVRWNHPKKGLIFPGQFVDVLERTGFLYKLDEYIWEQAAKKLREWKDRNIDYYIAINISAKDFYYLDLFKVFTGLVEKYQIDPKKLKLEITETVLMHDVEMHKKLISSLQEYGFSIEMDDFGSGYSSLNMLKDIKVDVLKIDMEFLRKTENEVRSQTILSTIMKMAKNLKISIITEGVENQKQADFLRKTGCDIFQGYFYSKPISIEEFEKKYLTEGAE